MRVAIVSAFPQDPDAPHGGVEAVSVALVRALAKFNDLDLHVVTNDPSCSTVSVREWEGVSVHRLPRLQRRTLLNAMGRGRRQIRAYLACLAPDVVHSHDSYGVMMKALPIPRVFTVHGFIHVDTAIEGGRLAWLRARVWRWLETGGWADQPHIISISPYVRERLSGVARGVIHDIDNPVDEAFFRIGRNERRGVVFSAAHISRLKNTLGLVQGFGRLVSSGYPAELRLAGLADDADYDRRVRELISSNGLTDRVVWLGKVDSARVREELAAASVFALVSLEENSPMGIEEAMAAGVPVVTSNCCGMPYLVRDGASGYLVNPHDPDDIAWRFKQLLEDDDLRSRMGAESRRIAEDRFHPAMVAQRTRDVYLRAWQDHDPSEGRDATRR